MAELRTYACDAENCKAIKKVGEPGWFIAYVKEGLFLILPFEDDHQFAREYHIGGTSAMHLCSESCAVKAMSRAIGAGK